jgi:plasmid stabilization system protein ParE
MRVVYTEAAIADLDDILAFLGTNHPSLVRPVEQRIRAVVAGIATWPESARIVVERPNVRVAPLVRYPYQVFLPHH